MSKYLTLNGHRYYATLRGLTLMPQVDPIATATAHAEAIERHQEAVEEREAEKEQDDILSELAKISLRIQNSKKK